MLPDAPLLAVVGVGALVMRGAGCTINDIWDRDIDRQVARTKSRPLASGALTVPQAVAALAAQLALGLGVLCQLNHASVLLGAASLPLVALYPYMKRVTNWPQLVLGMTFNWGALLGWTAVTGELNLAVTLPLYAAGIAWTLVYDTIYAIQDKVDDAKLGLHSTALHFGSRVVPILSTFAACTVAALALTGSQIGAGPVFYAVAVGGGGAHLAWQLLTLQPHNSADCAAKFRSNKYFGAIVFGAIVFDRLLAHKRAL